MTRRGRGWAIADGADGAERKAGREKRRGRGVADAKKRERERRRN
jgi:hypothetical protein